MDKINLKYQEDNSIPDISIMTSNRKEMKSFIPTLPSVRSQS